jgi:hypothetical protein
MQKSPKAILFFASFVGCGWLVANHYVPWLSAFGDGLSVAVFLALAAAVLLHTPSARTVSRPLFLVAAISAAMLLLQWLTGKILFSGDAVMAGFYVALWFAAVVTGTLIANSRFANGALNALTAGLLMAAVLSVGIALVQWTGALRLGIYMADLPPESRPFGNVAQPNHLATIFLIGLCSLLWLYERRELQRLTLWLGACFLLFGMAMSQSRTGWIQVGLVVTAGFGARQFYKSRVSLPQLTGLGAIATAWVLVWPRLCEKLLLTAGRSLSDQMTPGVRLPYWRAMLDAASQEPWFGYGWQQVGAAQQRVALAYPPLGSYFEHSHNFILDLLLWNGIPVALIIVVLLAWWLISQLRTIPDAGSVWLLVLAGGIVVHGMLEFPLEYAYFLIPLGLVMGLQERLAPSKNGILIPRTVAALSVGLMTVLFVWIATEYLSVEEAQRTLRMESARIGVSGITTPIESRRLLNQLEALQRFASTEATPGMSPDQLAWMHIVSLRFGYPSVLFRYALAAGLNGQPSVARDTLGVLCRIHPIEDCNEAKSSWRALQVRYPQLLSIAPSSVAIAVPPN